MATKAREEAERALVGKGKPPKGKTMWFVGRMIRQGREDGNVQPERAEKAVREVLGV